MDMTVNKANKVLGLLKRTVEIKNKDIFPGGGGGSTLGISGWGCAAGTLEPSAYTRASFSWILLPYTRVNSPNHSHPRVAVFQKLRSLAQSKIKRKENLIPQSLLY